MLRKRQSPKVCDCADPAHRNKQRTAQDTRKLNAPKKQKGREPNNRQHTRKQSSDQDDEQNGDQDGEQNVLLKEEAITVCRRCNKLSNPPRGKKISWRQSTGSRMYVNEWARKELPPFEDDLFERQTGSRGHCPDLDDNEELPDLNLLLKWAKDKRSNAESLGPDIEPHHDSESEIELLATPPQSPSGQQAMRRANLTPAQSSPTTPSPEGSQAAEHAMPTPFSTNSSSRKRRTPSPPLRSPIQKSRVDVLDLTGNDLDVEAEVENPMEEWNDL